MRVIGKREHKQQEPVLPSNEKTKIINSLSSSSLSLLSLSLSLHVERTPEGVAVRAGQDEKFQILDNGSR